MRKKAILKRYGSRRKMFKILRDTNYLQPFVNNQGYEIIINPVKHFLKEEPFKDLQYNRALMDIARKFSSFLKEGNVKEEV